LSLLAALISTQILFTGAMPPHLASDGVLYTVTGTDTSFMASSLRLCGIHDVADAGPGTMKFAVSKPEHHRVDCLVSQLAERAAIAQRKRWVE